MNQNKGKPMYLSARDIAAMTGQTKTHFLNDNAVRKNKSLGEAVGLERLGVHLITVAPGHESTEYHAHHYEEECTYVLSGFGSVRLGDETHRIGPGDFIGYPANGVPHTMINDGDEPLVCLVVGQRLVQDVCDYPDAGKRLYRNSGQWDLVDLQNIEVINR